MTWTFLSTRFGVVKSFCFSFMRFAKKRYMCIHFKYSQSLSGLGLATQMLLRDQSLPRARGLIFEAWYCHKYDASFRTYITFHCFALLLENVVLLFVKNMCPSVSSKASAKWCKQISENVMFQSEAQLKSSHQVKIRLVSSFYTNIWKPYVSSRSFWPGTLWRKLLGREQWSFRVFLFFQNQCHFVLLFGDHIL